jgi:glycosyltransferase involved in cell wall biosynthesis
MDTIKEVTVYTNGDADKISTWSNVPYFFTQTLRSKGIKVNLVDLSASRILNKIYTVFPFYRLIYKNTTFGYFRSLIHFLDARHRIKKSIKCFPSAQLHIFMTFSFSSYGLTTKPSVQFCDWPYEYYVNYFKKRNPDIFEKSSIERENSQIEGTNIIFPLFPVVANFMNEHYKNKNIYYLGNVINSLFTANESIVIDKKKESNNLVFIGSKKYLEGATLLVDAYNFLKSEFPELSLNFIGLVESDFDVLPDGVNCYGYLDKGNENDRALYYEILENAKVFINTTPKWGAFSATVEAMYFYTPVIVSPYDEFVNTFGHTIEFGYYCENSSLNLLCSNIKNIMNHKFYREICLSAHESVKDFTWDNYVDKMLHTIKEAL